MTVKPINNFITVEIPKEAYPSDLEIDVKAWDDSVIGKLKDKGYANKAMKVLDVGKACTMGINSGDKIFAADRAMWQVVSWDVTKKNNVQTKDGVLVIREIDVIAIAE